MSVFLCSNFAKSFSHELAIIFCGQWTWGENERSQAVVKALLGARDAMLAIRYQMRNMGDAAGIPVCALNSPCLCYLLFVCTINFSFHNSLS